MGVFGRLQNSILFEKKIEMTADSGGDPNNLDEQIFRAYDIRGTVGDQLTPKSVRRLGQTFGVFFKRNSAKRVAVARDARISSVQFEKIICEEIASTGLDVELLGMVPTPVLNHAIYTLDFDGGVMVTGSHNPPSYNGFKLSLGQHTLYEDEIQELRNIAFSGDIEEGSGEIRKINHLENYIDDICKKIKLGDRRLRVVIDAGNGVGGITAVPVLEKLGVDIVELYCEPDSNFPNHFPDPADPQNLVALQEVVANKNADFGISFDGDADRIALIDDKGKIIWGDILTAVFAREILKVNKGAVIIGEVKCSNILFDEIRNGGGIPIMSKAGHSIIKARMKETDAILAGEMSGHIFFRDRYYGFDDACYAAARICELVSNRSDSLSDIVGSFQSNFATNEIRIDCPEAAKSFVIEKVANEYKSNHDVDRTDGARINFGNGWVLIRPSNTQAILVIRAEADSLDFLDQIILEIKEFVIKAINQFDH